MRARLDNFYLSKFQREIENNAYAQVWRDNKQYYGIFEKGLHGAAISNTSLLNT